ncbi:MAG: exodeoxyribonuclease VII small subunit [Planctomycetota bacterium]
MAKNQNDRPTATDNQGEKSFENCLAELEEIVAQLEVGAKPLDESLTLYERGIASLKSCHAILDKAEKRIRLLVKGPNGEPLVREKIDGATKAGQNPNFS